MVLAMHDGTRTFGRDPAQKAAAFGNEDAAIDVREIARLTSAMIGRTASAEEQLASATREADALRVELAEAQATACCDHERANRWALRRGCSMARGRRRSAAAARSRQECADRSGHLLGGAGCDRSGESAEAALNRVARLLDRAKAECRNGLAVE